MDAPRFGGREREHDECRVRVEAPEGTDPLLIAQAIVGAGWLIKAERVRADAFGAHKAMEQSLDRFAALYKTMLRSLVSEVIGHLNELSKAAAPRPLLTPAQLLAIAQRIRDYHTAFVFEGIGKDAVDPAEIERLITLGILPEEARSIIDDAYQYGMLLVELRALAASKKAQDAFTYDQFIKRIERRPIPLTDHEQAAVRLAKLQAATYVRGLGNRVADDFTTIAIEADKRLAKRYRKVIEDAVSEGVERRKTVREIASEIGHKTGDWTRDLRRIAATEKQRAMQEGFKERLRHREGDGAMVAKIPTPDACDHCIRLHLTDGRGSTPRVFKLSALESNGTNVGRKAADWRAVVGPVHPWCACELVHVPEGWGFNESGDLVPNRLRKGWRFEWDLRKALAYDAPTRGVAVRVGDPAIVAMIDEVLSRTPPVLFTARTGFTLITSDYPAHHSHLEDHDFAYWTGNEIRLMQTIPPERVKAVLEHEIGHTLNVYLMHRFGGVKAVREWHDDLFAVSRSEGFVSKYASSQPIENAAEVTKLYLYEREHLAAKWPRQFRFVHRAYRDLFSEPENMLDAHGWTREADVDALSAADFYTRITHAAVKHGMEMSLLPNGARVFTLGAPSAPTLALLSGVHGDERAGPIALMRWLEDTQPGQLVPDGVSLWVCPLFVCEGWDTFKREVDGIDHNRVWMPGQKGRNDSVRAVEASWRRWRPAVFLDLHEDSDVHTVKPYIYGYARDRVFAPALAQQLGCRVKWWRGSDEDSIGATETYVRGLGCRSTSTVETPQARPLRERVETHLTAIRFAALETSDA